MRRASQEHTATVCPTFITPPAQVARSGATPKREQPSSRAGAIDAVSTEVLLLPNGTFVNGPAASEDHDTERCRQLAIAIRQRIESRLAGRIRNLAVRIVDRTIFLEGQCFTYYTKQLAQHAALGILDDEHLENAIVVTAPR